MRVNYNQHFSLNRVEYFVFYTSVHLLYDDMICAMCANHMCFSKDVLCAGCSVQWVEVLAGIIASAGKFTPDT